MEPAKIFSNVVIGQFILTGVPVKVYVDGRYLTITDADDVEDPIFGFGMDEDGDMQRFDYRKVASLLVAGEQVDLETYNKGMEDKFGGEEKEEDDKEENDKEGDDKEEDKEDDKEEEGSEEENPFKDHYMPSLGNLIREVSREEVDADIEGAEAAIDAAKAKAKAAQASLKTTIKKSKEKIKAAKAQPIDEGHADYTFGVGDIVKNKNKGCKHYGSIGVVKKLMRLANDMGVVALYTVVNSGPTFMPGQVLAKTIDQLEPIQKPDGVK